MVGLSLSTHTYTVFYLMRSPAITDYHLQNNMRAVLGTQRFWPQCGCFYLDFYYYAYGVDVYVLEVALEGYDQPLLSINLTSSTNWKHIRRTYYTDEPTEV